jgi:hypothetical protein
MGCEVFSLKRVRVSVTVDRKILEEIADKLGIAKADRASIINEGILITASTSAAGSTTRSARATTPRSSTASSTASRAKRPRK